MLQRSMGRAKTAIIHRLSPKMSIVHPWMICFDLPMPHEVFDLLNKEIFGLTRFGIDTPGYSQARSSVPPKLPLMIYYSKVESVGSCRFQIHLCILACVMSREFTHEAVTKFLPTQFP